MEFLAFLCRRIKKNREWEAAAWGKALRRRRHGESGGWKLMPFGARLLRMTDNYKFVEVPRWSLIVPNVSSKGCIIVIKFESTFAQFHYWYVHGWFGTSCARITVLSFRNCVWKTMFVHQVKRNSSEIHLEWDKTNIWRNVRELCCCGNITRVQPTTLNMTDVQDEHKTATGFSLWIRGDGVCEHIT